MDSDVKKRLVSEEQLNALLEFMKEHPELSRGLSRGRRGKLMTVKVWNDCSKKLNSIKEGAVKDGKGWSKYWCDWKYRVRRHALELKVARDTNKMPPEGIPPLSPIEKTIMSIIGDSSIDGVVVKSDPLVDEDSNEEGEEETNDNDAPNSQLIATRRTVRKRRREESPVEPNLDDEGDNDDDDHDDRHPGSPPRQRARLDDAEESESEEDDTSTQFLRLEKRQLGYVNKIQKCLLQMSLDISKLTEIAGDLRDVLCKWLRNVETTRASNT